jgi:hypothetical protein
MTKVTLSISKELKEKLDRFPELSWSEILRKGIKDKIKKLQRFEKLQGEL